MPRPGTTWSRGLHAAGLATIVPMLRGFDGTRFRDDPAPRTGNSGIHALDVVALMGASVQKVLIDRRLSWPDTLSEGPDGRTDIGASHIQDTQWFPPGAPPSIRTELVSFSPQEAA